MTLNAVEVLRKYCTEMEIGPAGCIAQMAPDIILHTPCIPAPLPKTLVGREAVEATFDALFTQLFKNFSWKTLEVLGTDDPTVAVALASSDVLLQDGRRYSNDYSFWCRIKDGKIVEHYEFMDGERALAAFKGLL